jgi:hypothetical protein
MGSHENRGSLSRRIMLHLEAPKPIKSVDGETRSLTTEVANNRMIYLLSRYDMMVIASPSCIIVFLTSASSELGAVRGVPGQVRLRHF